MTINNILRLYFYIFFILLAQPLSGEIPLIIRAFDLGGGGLKTALLSYNSSKDNMEWLEMPTQLGKCPDDMKISTWIRLHFQKTLGKNLDQECGKGYLFAFSIAGLNKLRTQPLETSDLSTLFHLQENKISSLADGSAHLLASLNTLDLHSVKGPIWNFSIGTGVGFAFTDDNHQMRKDADLWAFFGCSPWFIKEPHSQLDVWRACGSTYGFDQITKDRGGGVDEEVFTEFALRWKGFIDSALLDYSINRSPEKGWGTPAAVIFTGGHIDTYGKRLENTLNTLDCQIPVFTGPAYGGLLGAAWHAVIAGCGHSTLTQAIIQHDYETIQTLLSQGVDINQRAPLGKTPLSLATELGYRKCVELLLECGAKINHCDFAGFTPLHIAVKANHPDIVALLLKYNAEVYVRDYWGQLPSFFANQELYNICIDN